LDRGGNNCRLFNILQSFMFYYVSIYYFSYALELEWLKSLLLVVGRYMCQPWCLSKQEQYLIAEHYYHRVFYGNFSIGFVILEFVYLSYCLGPSSSP